MNCRPGCAACCIAPSISSPIPGMEGGKPAGVPCMQLDAQGRCRLFGQLSRPAVCQSLQPAPALCGDSRAEALQRIAWLERATLPPAKAPA
ncbi:YkgJ family cysteine cluster protein [Melaminivora sp.]|uniref:YkgJ family cysteine cluster protein n=1 Tax=Melaminivora sp. TaxID=1933032 RepID=UPI0028ACFA38|nr:YkgJ family cysteine cluster protein [Melaminivora sp.]